MAHQTANIPWNVLASNLYWSEVRHPGHGDLHLRFRPDQAKKLEYFVQGLVRNIREHSSTSRRKYPEHYDAPDLEDLILDDATVRKIAPTVRRWCVNKVARYYHPPEDDSPWNPVPEHPRAEWERQIPVEQRRAAAFYIPYTYYERTWYIHSKLFFNVEVVKTLLLYGEMDPIFRVCAHPDVELGTIWWRRGNSWFAWDEAQDAGWDTLCIYALLPYICLNVIQCFPETWDPASGRTDSKDYRRMRVYQYMLKQCTMTGTTSDLATYPHRYFFGIADDQFWVETGRECPYGLVSLEEFLECDQDRLERRPTPADVPQVRQMLYTMGLPMELVLDIMERAEYVPLGRLLVQHDPFHPENREELTKYLGYCWGLLVRCDMMGTALGMVIQWRDLVAEVMVRLFHCSHPTSTSRPWFGRNKNARPETYRFV